MAIIIDERLRAELAHAKEAVDAARARYNTAEGPWVDVRLYELRAAETRLSILLREARGESWPDGDGAA